MKRITVTGDKVYFIKDSDFLINSVCSYQIILTKNSSCKLYISLVNVSSVTLNIEVEAQGENSSFEIILLYALADKQTIKLITVQKHTALHTKSSFTARGMVKNNSSMDHQGLIFINEQAYKTDAELNHTAIVLDELSKVTLIPSIEVLTHDVSCAHGAAVGQFDKEHLWYLNSRGFDKKEAYKILAESFFGEFSVNFDEPESLLESLCQKIL